jgi:hypothetical protein
MSRARVDAPYIEQGIVAESCTLEVAGSGSDPDR